MIKRIKITIIGTMLCLCLLAYNIFNISAGNSDVSVNLTVNQRDNSILLNSCRGVIYDRNMQPLAGKELKNGVLVDPLKLTSEEIELLLENAENISKETVSEKINSGDPFYCTLKENISSDGFISIGTMSRYSKSRIAQNLFGYIDSDGNGVGGVEEFFNSLLKTDMEYRVSYNTDAMGQILDGLGLSFSGPANGANHGIVLSIDKTIQEICEKAADDSFEKGAIVVQDVSSGNIVANVSRPNFDPYDIEKYLSVDGAFLNKTMEEYCCGSAFKIAVTAAALENSDEINFSYNCTGHYNAGGIKIGCGNTDGHGLLTLKTAFAKSCNTYFCSLAQQLGAEKVYEMAEKMGFGSASRLGCGLFGKSGQLPLMRDLSTPAALANFSIGQGSLLVTPIQVSNMTNIIANGGSYYDPLLVLGYTENGRNINSKESSASHRVISDKTAKEIQNLMEYTVLYGTGINAAPVAYGAGAKTSTAETGIYSDGVQVYHTWVTGFVPANTPKYTITVLVEGGESGYYNAAPVMKKIADGLIAAGLY